MASRCHSNAYPAEPMVTSPLKSTRKAGARRSQRLTELRPGHPSRREASGAAWLGYRSTPIAMLSGLSRCAPVQGMRARRLPPTEGGDATTENDMQGQLPLPFAELAEPGMFWSVRPSDAARIVAAYADAVAMAETFRTDLIDTGAVAAEDVQLVPCVNGDGTPALRVFMNEKAAGILHRLLAATNAVPGTQAA